MRERIDTDQVNGVGGAMSDSTIDGLYIHHTKVGLWFDGPMDNADRPQHDRRRRRSPTRSTSGAASRTRRVEHSFFRNTGDDAMAMWSHNVSTVEVDENANNVFDHNTIQTPTLANGIAIYGGRDITVSNNIVADPIREGSGLHAGQRFNSTPFAGYLRFTNNTTVRAGTFELNWNIGLGAIWLYALEGSLTADIEVTGDHYLQNTYNAIMLVVRLAGEGPVLDHERPLQGRPRRRDRHLGAECPGRRARRRSRTSTRATSAPSGSTTAARSTSRRPAPSSP